MQTTQQLTTTGMWIVELGELPQTLRQKADGSLTVSRLLGENHAGQIAISEDVGARSWLSRLLGLHPRFLQLHLVLEWHGNVASLIFSDDAASEHRAKDVSQPVHADEATRKAIAHGELTPLPPDECMALDRARKAVEEYLQTGTRPAWLHYEYTA